MSIPNNNTYIVCYICSDEQRHQLNLQMPLWKGEHYFIGAKMEFCWLE